MIGEIRLVEHEDGSISVMVNDVERGKYRTAQDGLLFLGLCVARIDELENEIAAMKTASPMPPDSPS